MLEAVRIIAPAISKILDDILPDNSPETTQKKLDITNQIVGILGSSMAAQVEINKIAEAQPGIFSKWRDAIGWVCAISFAYGFFIKDFIDYYLQLNGQPPLPEIDTKDLMVVMTGMLGIGSIDALVKMRTGIK